MQDGREKDILELFAEVALYDDPGSTEPRYMTCCCFEFKEDEDKKGILIGKAKDLKHNRPCFMKLLKLPNGDLGSLSETEKYIYNNLSREGKFEFYYPYLEQVYGNVTVRTKNKKGYTGSKYYGVSVEHVDGENLREIWDKRNSGSDDLNMIDDLTEETVFRHILQFLYGMRFYLNYAAPVYLHRDLKPENVMIDRRGNVKIIDYDISHISGSTDTEKGEHGLGFSRGYSSPNTIGRIPDIRDEFYAAGRLLFFWLNGRDYFTPEEKGPRGVSFLFAPYIMDHDLGYGTETERYEDRYKAEEYDKLRRILEKMCCLPKAKGYTSIDDIIEDYIVFLNGKYGKKLYKVLQPDEMPLLSDELIHVDDRNAPNVRFKVMDGSPKEGKKLFLYGMRDYEVDNAIAITLYNIGNEIYYVPIEGTRRVGNVGNREDYKIHNGDTFETENGTKFIFNV